MSVFIVLDHANAKRVNPNPELRVQQYISDAKKGHAGAQFLVGEIYYNGYSIQKNKQEAYAWYKVAAIQKEPKAREALEKIRNEMTVAEVEAAEILAKKYSEQFIIQP